MSYFKVIVCIIMCTSCTNKNELIKDQEIIIKNIPKSIKIIIKDSIYYKLLLEDSGNLRSILPYNSGVLEGNTLEFYPNGGLKKFLDLKSGRLSGNAVYFYESGALWKKIRFNRDQKEFLKIEFWENFMPVLKHYYEIDSNGTIIKIQIFNINGQFIKDSFPENRSVLNVE